MTTIACVRIFPICITRALPACMLRCMARHRPWGAVWPILAGLLTVWHPAALRLRRLNMTFTYSQPAFGADRAKQLVATQEAVLKARARPSAFTEHRPPCAACAKALHAGATVQ